MPFNDKNQWVNPPIEMYPKDELDRGYSVCYCKEGVHLHQAGYEVELHMCSLCASEVANVEDFLTAEECEKLRPKVTVKDEINTPDNFDLM